METHSSASHGESVLGNYVNDMIALERDIINAIQGQCTDQHIEARPDVFKLLRDVAEAANARHANLEVQCARLHGETGAAIKEALATAAGTLASLYGMIRRHPVSKMLRDDVTALQLAATSYGMLYTTALAFEDEHVAEVALKHLNELPQQIRDIARLLPGIISEELAKDDPSVNVAAAELAGVAISEAWRMESEGESSATSTRRSAKKSAKKAAKKGSASADSEAALHAVDVEA